MKPGFLTSEFWLHLVVVVAGSAGFWHLVQQYAPTAANILQGTPLAGIAPLLALASAFAGFMVTVASMAKNYSDGRVALKSAPIPLPAGGAAEKPLPFAGG